ncbi:MAG: hypothetical protein HC896_03935 [Bacteroidales bacterium]|nr:hypothetical protein [Bacteroidales bacterium]
MERLTLTNKINSPKSCMAQEQFPVDLLNYVLNLSHENDLGGEMFQIDQFLANKNVSFFKVGIGDFEYISKLALAFRETIILEELIEPGHHQEIRYLTQYRNDDGNAITKEYFLLTQQFSELYRWFTCSKKFIDCGKIVYFPQRKVKRINDTSQWIEKLENNYSKTWYFKKQHQKDFIGIEKRSPLLKVQLPNLSNISYVDLYSLMETHSISFKKFGDFIHKKFCRLKR